MRFILRYADPDPPAFVDVFRNSPRAQLSFKLRDFKSLQMPPRIGASVSEEYEYTYSGVPLEIASWLVVAEC